MNLIQQPSAWIFLVGFVIYVGIRARFESKVEAEAKTVEDRKDGVEKALLGLVLIGSLLIPVLYLLTPLFAFADRERLQCRRRARSDRAVSESCKGIPKVHEGIQEP